MEVRIQSIHFDASEQLQSFVQKKVEAIVFVGKYIFYMNECKKVGEKLSV